MAKPSVSALILAKNEERMLPACLRTVAWCQEIVVLDDDSSDQTKSIARDFGAKVIHFTHPSFAQKRMKLAQLATCDWLLYIDPDERITPALAQEIKRELVSCRPMQFHRQNIFFGQVMKFGGWQHDQVIRVFPKSQLTGWRGDIHESPEYSGQPVILTHPLIHFSHRSIQEGLVKSVSWTKLEADALFAAQVSPVTKSTLIRKALGEFYRRLVREQGYRDGMVGFVESVVQSLNRVLVYLQLWELQQQPTIPMRYQDREREIELAWKTAQKKEK